MLGLTLDNPIITNHISRSPQKKNQQILGQEVIINPDINKLKIL